MLNYITWNMNPSAFHIFGIEIRWYGVLFACAFLVGFYLLRYILKKEGKPDKLADSLLYYVLFSVIIGARLGHCLFYEPEYFLTHPLKIITGFREGGLASHGAAIGIIVALILVARKYKLSFWYLVDRVVIMVAIGGFLIRTGNLFNSEIYGNVTHLPWGFIFERNHEILPKHPTQIYEGLSYLLLFFFMMWYYLKKKRQPKDGIIFGIFLIGCFGMRFLIEFVKENQEIWEDNMLLNMGQILSLPFVILGIVVLILGIKEKLPFQIKTQKK
ncbi:prolipoprotein diacylglyceryl transferase [Bacteroidia bacterium]|nr:prolipoprotein diacylglyceryl transferase [Bacteroidia bacterium]